MGFRSSTQLILICILLSSINQSVSAADRPTITLWTDAEQSHCEFYTDSSNVNFDIYVVLEPGPDGAFGAAYKINIPENHFMVEHEPASFVIYDPDYPNYGVPAGPPGVTAPFSSCQTETVVIWRITCTSTNTDPAQYWFAPHDISGIFVVAICPNPHPLVDLFTYNCFGYNQWCGCSSAVEENSWGAIKNMYR